MGTGTLQPGWQERMCFRHVVPSDLSSEDIPVGSTLQNLQNQSLCCFDALIRCLQREAASSMCKGQQEEFPKGTSGSQIIHKWGEIAGLVGLFWLFFSSLPSKTSAASRKFPLVR